MISGICRLCGCTENSPCILGSDYETCAWVDAEQTLCSNPRCIAKVELAELLAMMGLAAAFEVEADRC